MCTPHPLYQNQVVFKNDDIGVASTKPRKWLTQSSISVIFILQNHKSFSCVHISNLISGFLSNIDYVSLKIKRLETSSLVFKFGKPPKPPKIKFVTKPPLKNQHRYRAHNCEMYFRTLFFFFIKGLNFDQSMFEPIKNPNKTL